MNGVFKVHATRCDINQKVFGGIGIQGYYQKVSLPDQKKEETFG